MAKQEKILNVPNVLTLSRILLAFVIVYLIIIGFDITIIVAIFLFAAFTDFLDGQIARRFNLETNFGRKFDVRADRILWGGTALTFLIAFSIQGILTDLIILQIFLIMSRELISLPFVFSGFVSKKPIPEVRRIGKITTFLQGITLPLIMLSAFSGFFSFSIYFSIITGIFGIVSASYFIRDLKSVKK